MLLQDTKSRLSTYISELEQELKRFECYFEGYVKKISQISATLLFLAYNFYLLDWTTYKPFKFCEVVLFWSILYTNNNCTVNEVISYFTGTHVLSYTLLNNVWFNSTCYHPPLGNPLHKSSPSCSGTGNCLRLPCLRDRGARQKKIALQCLKLTFFWQPPTGNCYMVAKKS